MGSLIVIRSKGRRETLHFSLLLSALSWGVVMGDNCKITPIFHVLSGPAGSGCESVPIPSFACVGKCTSYVTVSGSKVWEIERSCNCCQESGVREAVVPLKCPNAPPGMPKIRKIVAKAPVECMCRPCTSVDEGSILPQEMANFIEDGKSFKTLSIPFQMSIN